MPEWRPAVEREARARLGRTEADAFLTRLELLSADITEPLAQVYGPVTDPGQLTTELVVDALKAAAIRPARLRMLDRRREIDPSWFQRTGISGMTASLCGIEAALATGDPGALTAAIRRLESLYAVAFSFGGLPLIYMGDELALRNDSGWARDPAHEHDNRSMHRPAMDWAAAARRHDPDRIEGRVFAAIRALAAARRPVLALRAGGSTEVLRGENRSVLAYRRAHPRSAPFLAMTNFSDVTQSVDAGIIARAGLHDPAHVHSSTGQLRISAGRIELPPWGFAWLAGA